MPEFKIYSDKAALSQAATEHFIKTAQLFIEKQGRFSVCLSGGSTPKAMFELLAKKENASQVDWNKTFFFWGDERCVAPTHSDSNYLMTKTALLDKVSIPSENVFRIKGELPPKLAAEEYNNCLKNYFSNKAPIFDLCFLGMGDDGHTASLFPNSKAIHLKRKRVKEVYVKKFDSWRVTLTAPVLNRSRNIAFLVAGANKNEVLKEVLKGDLQPNLYPSQLIRNAKNEVVWLLDEAASGGISI